MTVTDSGYAWESLAPDGDCPKCNEPDCFKSSPMYDNTTDTLVWSCHVCGYEINRPPADSEAGYVK